MSTFARIPAGHVAFALLTAFAATALPADEKIDIKLEERLDVSRVLLDVRAVDDRGRAIPDLTAQDFRIEVDGQEVRVESADWITGTLPDIAGLEVVAEESEGWEPGRGRLIVLLFQRDLMGTRIKGLMRMRDILAGFVEDLPAQDRVAILVHDTRLKIYSDFTDDRQRLSEILAYAIVEQRPPGEVPPGPRPSLLAEIDTEDARDAAHVEDALLLLGQSLRRIPGAKTLVFVGWGLNRWDGATETLGQALGLLIAGRVTMFSMDVTDADYHTLEAPMVQAAEESGGFYVKTHVFSEVAMSQVQRAMSGVYEVAFIKPHLESGRHSIRVALRSRKGRAYHRRFYDD